MLFLFTGSQHVLARGCCCPAADEWRILCFSAVPQAPSRRQELGVVWEDSRVVPVIPFQISSTFPRGELLVV